MVEFFQHIGDLIIHNHVTCRDVSIGIDFWIGKETHIPLGKGLKKFSVRRKKMNLPC